MRPAGNQPAESSLDKRGRPDSGPGGLPDGACPGSAGQPETGSGSAERAPVDRCHGRTSFLPSDASDASARGPTGLATEELGYRCTGHRTSRFYHDTKSIIISDIECGELLMRRAIRMQAWKDRLRRTPAAHAGGRTNRAQTRRRLPRRRMGSRDLQIRLRPPGSRELPPRSRLHDPMRAEANASAVRCGEPPSGCAVPPRTTTGRVAGLPRSHSFLRSVPVDGCPAGPQRAPAAADRERGTASPAAATALLRLVPPRRPTAGRPPRVRGRPAQGPNARALSGVDR